MISSTPSFSFLKALAASLAVVLAALALSHAALEALAEWAEAKPGYYLWTVDDHLVMLNRDRILGKQEGSGASGKRMFIFGASEAGEGLVDGAIAKGVPGVAVQQLSFDGATFHDALVQLSYLERVYGKAALPSYMLFGLTPRFVANVTVAKFRDRFNTGVDRFSTSVRVDHSKAQGRLVPKSKLQALTGWLNFRVVQTERYRSAVNALVLEIDSRLHPGQPPRESLLEHLRKAKLRHRVRASDQDLRGVLTGKDHWLATHSWKPSEHPGVVEKEMGSVVAFAKRNNIRLYFVNLPEWPINKQMFGPGVYDDYLSAIRAASGGYPFLDLGDFLADSEFVDAVHPSAQGADRLSAATADFIRQADITGQPVAKSDLQ